MIALLQLARQKIRFLTGVCGVSFAIILILMQLGFQAALFDSSTQLHKSMDADLFIIDAKTSSIVSCRQFPRARLYQALGHPSVRAVEAVYVARANCRVGSVPQSRPIFVIGVDPRGWAVGFQGKDQLSNEGTVLFDTNSRKEFGPVVEDYTRGIPVQLQMENRRIKVVGTFKLGTSFGADGNVLASRTTFMKLFPNRRLGSVDIGAIKLAHPSESAQIRKELLARVSPDVKILTKNEFIDFEQSYWRTTTAIGFIFRMGVILSLVVGAIIVYQILYSDISDHLSEYATLLAMGYSMRFLYDIVFQEAIILAIIGFIPGLFVSYFLYDFTTKSTGLPLALEPERAVLTLSLGIVMCCIAAGISSIRLRSADPADVFSGG